MGDWTEEIEREERVYPPIHPGEVLREEWLVPLGMRTRISSPVPWAWTVRRSTTS